MTLSCYSSAFTQLEYNKTSRLTTCPLLVFPPLYLIKLHIHFNLPSLSLSLSLQDHHSGKTPLHLAVEQGSFQIIQTLVRSCNSNIDSVTFSGCTPLHFAAGHDRLDIVAYLVSLGADPFRLTDEGDTAWDLASEESVRDFLGSVTDMYCD